MKRSHMNISTTSLANCSLFSLVQQFDNHIGEREVGSTSTTIQIFTQILSQVRSKSNQQEILDSILAQKESTTLPTKSDIKTEPLSPSPPPQRYGRSYSRTFSPTEHYEKHTEYSVLNNRTQDPQPSTSTTRAEGLHTHYQDRSPDLFANKVPSFTISFNSNNISPIKQPKIKANNQTQLEKTTKRKISESIKTKDSNKNGSQQS